MKKLLIIIGLIFVMAGVVHAQSSVSPPDGMSEAGAYSIFLENYKNDDYGSAMRYGRWIWKGMPETIRGYSAFDLEKNLGRLVTVYNEYSQQLEDPSIREAYLDTALIIFDKAFNQLGEEINLYHWHLDRGRFYQENSSFLDQAMAKAVADYKNAFDLKPQELTELADGYYIRIMLQNMVGDGQKQESLALIEQAEPYATPGLSDYFDKMRNRLFDSPEERMAFLEEKMKENPEDLEILEKLRDLYDEQDMLGKAQELNKKLYELDPNFENTRALAEFAIRNANYQEAKKFLKEAMNKTDDNIVKAELALKLSESYKNTDDLPQARRYARQTLDLRSGWGKPYIEIASIYAQAVTQCTSDRSIERPDRAVYWLVVDYLKKAKRVDPTVSSAADRQIASYESVMPSAEDVHFTSEWTKGESITIDASVNECYSWINESTKVRY